MIQYLAPPAVSPAVLSTGANLPSTNARDEAQLPDAKSSSIISALYLLLFYGYKAAKWIYLCLLCSYFPYRCSLSAA
jgi:hypothetical protein